MRVDFDPRQRGAYDHEAHRLMIASDPHLALAMLSRYIHEQSVLPSRDPATSERIDYFNALVDLLAFIPASERASMYEKSFDAALVQRFHPTPGNLDDIHNVEAGGFLRTKSIELAQQWIEKHPRSIAAREISVRGISTSVKNHVILALEIIEDSQAATKPE